MRFHTFHYHNIQQASFSLDSFVHCAFKQIAHDIQGRQGSEQAPGHGEGNNFKVCLAAVPASFFYLFFSAFAKAASTTNILNIVWNLLSNFLLLFCAFFAVVALRLLFFCLLLLLVLCVVPGIVINIYKRVCVCVCVLLTIHWGTINYEHKRH